MSNTLNLELPYLAEAQAQKHVTVNDALRRIDAVVQLAVTSRSFSSPPVSPQEGERHIVAAPASGAWEGHELDVAAYVDGAWVFFTPQEGWTAYVASEEAILYFVNGGWEIFVTASGGDAVATLGVNAAANTTNRLTVASEAALFIPDNTQATPTGDVRVVMSKESAADVASHVFQTNYAGRAEFGLIGSDDFSLKVSANGSAFNEAFSVDRSSAVVDFSQPIAVGGTQAVAYTVDTGTLLQSAVVPADIEFVTTRGFTSLDDGGGGLYQRVASFPSDGLGFQDGAGAFWALAGSTVTARQAGAVGDGTTDDTAALNLALASNRTVHIEKGDYRVTDALSFGGNHQRVYGDGPGRTNIRVGTDFNMSAVGVFNVNVHFVNLSELMVDFDQSSASSRATLVQYPPAVYMVNRTRARLTRLRFENAYDGVDGRENAGGAILSDIECGSLNEGFRFGGSLDTVEFVNCRTWPYGFSGDAGLMAIYGDGDNVGFRIGRIDDLKMTNCTPFQTTLIFEATAGVGPFGTVTGLALDGSRSGIVFEAGKVSITSLYCTTAIAGDRMVVQTGGEMVLSDFSFRADALADVPFIDVSGDARCVVQSGVMQFADGRDAHGFRVTGGFLSIANVRFKTAQHVARNVPFIEQTGGVLKACGNSVTSATTGSGEFIRIATDLDHAIVGNMAAGWDYVLPASRTLGLYGPNSDGGGARFDTAVAVDDGSVSSTLSSAGLTLSPAFTVSRGAAQDLESVAVGERALESATSGAANAAVGLFALRELTSGSQNAAFGARAGQSVTTSAGNTFVGWSAAENVTGNHNTAIGRLAMSSGPTNVTNSTAIGNSAVVSGSNEVQLGNSATTTYVYGSVQSRSDERDKVDVRETSLGLAFINALRPVDYRWDYREDYERPADVGPDEAWEPPAAGVKARRRYHHGFLAQQVRDAGTALGVDFGGYQDHGRAGGRDVHTLGYTELIAPIVKAVQELSRRVDRLEGR